MSDTRCDWQHSELILWFTVKDQSSELSEDYSELTSSKLEKTLIDAQYFHHEPHQQQFTKENKTKDLKQKFIRRRDLPFFRLKPY